MSIVHQFYHHLRIVFLTVALFSVTGCDSSFNIVSTQQSAQSFTISTNQYQLQVSAVGPDSLEFLYSQENRPPFPSFAKQAERAWPLSVTEREHRIELTSGQITGIINKQTGVIEFYRDQQLLSTQQPYDNQGPSFRFSLQKNEKMMGAGQRVLGMDRRGHKLPLYNRADYGYETESQQMNYSLPAVMSDRQYYLLFDNTAKGTLDIAATTPDTLQFHAVGGRAAYIIGADTSYPDLIDEYTQVTGRPAMLPRWALGHFISRFGYRTQQEVQEVVDLTLSRDIPADAVILDLYWFGPDIKGHMGNLAWDDNYFPEPQKMIDSLNQKAINTILITEPFILTSSDRWQESVDAGALAMTDTGDPYRFDFYFGNTGLIDIFSNKGKQWFADRYRELNAQNVAGHWGDLGEPEVHPDDIQHYFEELGDWVRGDVLHNAYGHEWAKLVYDTEKSINTDRRPFILMRSGFAGTQRYGIIPWTGDVNRSWGGLKPQVELSLQMSLFGLGYTHSDIGGFAGTEGYSPELYLRWSQYGIFQPIFRPHAQEQIASEVVFQDPEVRGIVRDFIKLRYQMTPYNYTLMHEHVQTGMPLMRPMFFEAASNPDWIEIKDQYLWGDAFLVKPITDADIQSATVILPTGYWFDFWTDTVYEGGQTVDVPVTLRDIPVLVRAGSFVPMVPEFSHMRDYSSERLLVHYYHHPALAKSQGKMYEDDGITDDAFAKGQYQEIAFGASQNESQLVLTMESLHQHPMMQQNRSVQLIIHGLSEKPNDIQTEDVAISSSTYEPQSGQLTLAFEWQNQSATIRLIK